jgi:hypothetical protein
MPALRSFALVSVAIALSTLGRSASASGPFPVAVTVDCSRGESLAGAPVLGLPGATVYVKGTCAGPITLAADGLTLIARGATIDGGGRDAVTITGAQRITLTGFQISGGASGVVVERGAHVTLKNVIVTGNAQAGVLVQSGSGLVLDGGSSSGNGFAGIDVEATSAVSVTGAYTVSGNGVFGVQVNNGSSLTLSAARLTVGNNTLGVQLGTNASGFMDARSQLDTSRNFTVGLTLVSGAHMVDFGGPITSGSNGIHGISLNSKAGLDLDAASQVEVSGNGSDGVHLEQLSLMTIFNNPQFSQAPGTTLVTANGNGRVGIHLLTGSRILVDDFAALRATSNLLVGVALDDTSALSFGQTVPVTGVTTVVTGNPVDLQLTFGSRLTTLANDTFGVVSCDATVLVRGPGGITCPR